MAKNLPTPHLFQTDDPDKGKWYPRTCLHCPLPESRLDVHPSALPDTPPEAREAETARYGDH